MTSERQRYDVILFDLGGVLIELTGVPRMQEWGRGMSTTDLWRRWLTSDAVRHYETGRGSTAEFADAMVSEFDLPVNAETFLAEFRVWPRGWYAGAEELVGGLARTHRVACMSNTNALHWERFEDELALPTLFEDGAFASHQIGHCKPDPEAFEHVLNELAVTPERVLFLDDNQMNVDAAVAAGMHARLAHGVSGASTCLRAAGVLRD